MSMRVLARTFISRRKGSHETHAAPMHHRCTTDVESCSAGPGRWEADLRGEIKDRLSTKSCRSHGDVVLYIATTPNMPRRKKRKIGDGKHAKKAAVFHLT